MDENKRKKNNKKNEEGLMNEKEWIKTNEI